MLLRHESNYTTHALGRNGEIKQAGWELFKTCEDSVMIEPLTSLHKVARCTIEIHKDDLVVFIEHLQQIQQEIAAKETVAP